MYPEIRNSPKAKITEMNKAPDRIRIKDIARLAEVSVGTVDRVLHGRSGVSEESKKRIEKIMKQLDYHPNMYASALASNRKYAFACLLPQHETGEYWTDVERGIGRGIAVFSDFQISSQITYYDPYDYHSFEAMGAQILKIEPDGVLLAPTTPKFTKPFTEELSARGIPYIYIDSNIKDNPPLAFFGQNSRQSGYFAARMMMMLAGNQKEIVIFRKINEGVVGSNQQENREIGFRQYMDEHHPDCKILELDLHAKESGNDRKMMDAFFAKHPSVTDGITFNSKVYIIGEYLRAQEIKKFHLTGYDLLARNVNCLKDGSVSFLIAQQPEMQGYNGIKTLCDYLILKKEVATINYMPIDFLTAENIDYYLKLY